MVPSRGSRSDDHVITRRSNTNPLDLHSDELLDELDVLPRLAGQVVVALCAGGRLLPPRQSLVVDLYLSQHIRVGRETLELLSLVRVSGGNFELVEVVENIQFSEVEGGVVVASVRVLKNNEVEPSATALAAGRDTDLVADLLQLLANFVELFGGEGATVSCQLQTFCAGSFVDLRSNAGSVCLHYTNDLLNRTPAQGETCDNTTEACVRGRDKGICAIVDVEHESVGALNKDLCVLLLCRLEQRNLVDDVRSDLRSEFLEFLISTGTETKSKRVCLTLYLAISSSTSYLRRSPKRFW